MIRRRITSPAAWMAIAMLTLTLPAAAPAQGEMRDVARKMAVDSAEAIVAVRAVVSIKMSFRGQQEENEVKREVNGIIIAPDGSTVVPLSEIDPSHMYDRMVGAEQRAELSVDSQLKDLKIIVNRTTEIPATVVMRDADLDLAIIRPTEKQERTLKTIDLENSAVASLLDPCFVLARMGRVGDNVVGAMSGEVQAIVTKPRTFYIPSGELASAGLGVPAFNAEGKLLGMILGRVMPRSADTDDGGDNSLVVIMPASDLKEIVAQAKE